MDPAAEALAAGVLAGERRALARAITLVESSRREHQLRAQSLLEALSPHAGRSLRLGVSGAPGVGKSTLLEALGVHVAEEGRRVAVLAVDPSSAVSGGSILGDKTRMERLAQHPNAFIRPSPSRGTLGGVAEKTREAILLCEAAGYGVIIVETVGVGQSEIAVAGMVDMFVLLQLPHAGDELQALKKGIIELADVVVINKADLDARAAELARAQVQNVLTLLAPASPEWAPPVLAVSALTGAGVPGLWNEVTRFEAAMTASGELQARRRRQAVDWMWGLIDVELRARFRRHPAVRDSLDRLTAAVSRGALTPSAAALELLAAARENT
ncbi:MAG: methylmalonyl Co-A mutase-associated GTPase MeaB [Betaproteobacteria bacterium]|nr:methylmalonyl Co-A mutase-associated GTPase MeaB [Betaproteobacteria bacterium]